MATPDALGLSDTDIERYVGVMEEAEERIEAAVNAGDFEALTLTVDSLWERSVVNEDSDVVPPMLRASRLQNLTALFRELSFVLEHDCFPKIADDQRRDAVDVYKARAAEAEGRTLMVFVGTAPALRNFTLARDQSREAAQRFREAWMLVKDPKLRVLIGYAEANQYLFEGHSLMAQGNASSASAAYMRSRAKFKTLSSSELSVALGAHPNDAHLRALQQQLPFISTDVDFAYEEAAYQDRLRNRDANSARAHAEQAVGIALKAAASHQSAGSPLGPMFERYLEMRRAAGEGHCAFADAVRLQAEGRCPESRDAYERARAHYLDAAASASELPPEQAVSEDQYVMFATVFIDAQLRQLDAEEELRRDIEGLKRDREELLNSLNSAAGTTIYNQAEARAAVDSTVNITNQVEVSIRHLLPDLARELSTGPDELAALAESVEDLERSDDKGLSFIERAKNVTRDIAEVVKNIGESAGTVYPVAKLLGLLVGVPLP